MTVIDQKDLIRPSDFLSITRPEDLFPGDPERAKHVYRELVKIWHPDRMGGNTVVFAHITDLYDQAIDRLNRGVWEGSAVLNLQAVQGPIQFAIRASAPFELGHSLVGDDHVSYLIDPAYAKVLTYADWSKKFVYANPKMQAEFARYLPKPIGIYKLTDGRFLWRVEKTPDLIRLRDVITHLGGLDARHTAWIISSLLNLACYLSYTRIVHHDISPDTYFISPKYHSGALLGGWWYARSHGNRISAVPRRTFDILPFKVKVNKQASTQTDLECIRLIGRECLTSPAPEPMHAWLHQVGSGSALDQYKSWREVLTKTFGARKFVKLAVDADAVYGHDGKH